MNAAPREELQVTGTQSPSATALWRLLLIKDQTGAKVKKKLAPKLGGAGGLVPKLTLDGAKLQKEESWRQTTARGRCKVCQNKSSISSCISAFRSEAFNFFEAANNIGS